MFFGLVKENLSKKNHVKVKKKTIRYEKISTKEKRGEIISGKEKQI